MLEEAQPTDQRKLRLLPPYSSHWYWGASICSLDEDLNLSFLSSPPSPCCRSVVALWVSFVSKLQKSCLFRTDFVSSFPCHSNISNFYLLFCPKLHNKHKIMTMTEKKWYKTPPLDRNFTFLGIFFSLTYFFHIHILDFYFPFLFVLLYHFSIRAIIFLFIWTFLSRFYIVGILCHFSI